MSLIKKKSAKKEKKVEKRVEAAVEAVVEQIEWKKGGSAALAQKINSIMRGK